MCIRDSTRAAGRVYFNNRLMNFSSAKEAMEHGFAMITEELSLIHILSVSSSAAVRKMIGTFDVLRIFLHKS